jgi:hypothetical protein
MAHLKKRKFLRSNKVLVEPIMRKIIPFLLLVSALPAMASAQDQGGWRHSSQSNQSDSNDHHSQRAERSESRPQVREQVQPHVRAERHVQFQGQSNGQGNASGYAAMRERLQVQQQQQQLVQQQNETSRTQRWTRVQDTQGGATSGHWTSHRGTGGTNPQIVEPQTVTRDGSHYDRNGTIRNDRNNTTRWSNNWRNDSRYDWRNYRNRHRSTFHIGFYFDPFGYGYQRFGIGSFLNAGYYQSNYWIDDPWQYRLPPAYGPYRWVRYHNDALLIDTWNGEVVDVIYGFFW